jgi:prefoldin alpha subunit
LSTQQLSQVKKQLDDELEHLTNSFSQLRAAQAKFRECLKSIAGGVNSKVDSEFTLFLVGRALTVLG